MKLNPALFEGVLAKLLSGLRTTELAPYGLYIVNRGLVLRSTQNIAKGKSPILIITETQRYAGMTAKSWAKAGSLMFVAWKADKFDMLDTEKEDNPDE
jgi:hypothetical protein